MAWSRRPRLCLLASDPPLWRVGKGGSGLLWHFLSLLTLVQTQTGVGGTEQTQSRQNGCWEDEARKSRLESWVGWLVFATVFCFCFF